MRRFGTGASASDVRRFLRRLRRPAKVFAGHLADPIGGIDDRRFLGCDDRRIRWAWWLDEQACERALLAGGAS